VLSLAPTPNFRPQQDARTDDTKKNAVLWTALDVAGSAIGGRMESNCSLYPSPQADLHLFYFQCTNKNVPADLLDAIELL